jgi:hypothetical protein
MEKVKMENSMQSDIESRIKNRNSWLIFIVVISLIFIISYSVLTGKVNIDGMTLLSFLLAFFSIFLSATFYFKATEQSNQFYDRSYSHTKDIAESLSSMRGEFGKSLNFLEEHNASLHRRMDAIPWSEIQSKKETLNEYQKERESLINDLLEKAGLQSDEKKEYEEKLTSSEETINSLKNELNSLRNINKMSSLGDYNDIEELIKTILFFFIDNEEYNSRLSNGEDIRRVFSDYLRTCTLEEVSFLKTHGIISEDNKLLKKGLIKIKNMI